jgi:hypothetical protein
VLIAKGKYFGLVPRPSIGRVQMQMRMKVLNTLLMHVHAISSFV